MSAKNSVNITNHLPSHLAPICSRTPRYYSTPMSLYWSVGSSIVENGFRWESRRSRLRKSRAATLTRDHHDTYSDGEMLNFHGLHHVGLLCENLEISLKFYCEILGLSVNPDRPHKKLPYRGAWLWIGSEMIHLMELPNPDLNIDHRTHGGRDRHICVGIASLDPLIEKLKAQGIEYSASMSGRKAVFFRDPSANGVEVFEAKK